MLRHVETQILSAAHILAPFQFFPLSSLLTFIFLSVIVLICHVSDPNFQVLECFQGSPSALSPLLFLIRAIVVTSIPGRERGAMFRCLLSQNQ